MDKIIQFTERSLRYTENTDFYYELKSFIEKVKNEEIINLFESSKHINGCYRSYVISIIVPLCIYYKRERSIEWIINNVRMKSSSSTLTANMLKLNLSLNELPEKWISKKNILLYLCDDVNIIKEYIKENHQSIEDIMNNDRENITNSSLQVLEYLYENKLLDNYSTSLILNKFIDSTYNSHIDKSKIYTEHDKLTYIMNKRNPTCDDFLEAFSETEYMICESIYNHLKSNYTNADCERYLRESVKINDKNINYLELDYEHEIESIYFCAMKLNIAADALCKKTLSIPKNCIKDYIKDYNNFIKKYNNHT